jgi:heat-inducible transcriptional repressor
MLSTRHQTILDFIIGEYVSSAAPVPSQTIAHHRGLGVSSATVRNAMADLESDGYIRRRHVSSGGIPSDKGYRYYVEMLPAEAALSEQEEAEVNHRFEEVTDDVALWTRLTADVLASMVQNVAIASVPKAGQTRIKRVELVSIQEALALLILVFQQATTKQRLIHLSDGMSQDDLTALSNKLSAVYGGSTYKGITAAAGDMNPAEAQVLEATKELMLDEEMGRFEEPQVVGLRHLLEQPEFASSAKGRMLMEMLEDRRLVKDLVSGLVAHDRFKVAIGDENASGEMQECSVVASRYGSDDTAQGFIAILGPTRLRYGRSIAAVRLLASVMGDRVGRLA